MPARAIRFPVSRPMRQRPRRGRRSTMPSSTRTAIDCYAGWPSMTPSNAGPESSTGQWHTSIVPVVTPHLGLVLTGGGARAAYQGGVLKGIAEILRRGSACPFPIITGTSAGAVSAIALGSDPAHFRQSVYAIERVWRDFRVHHVFKADPVSVFKSGLHWMLAVISGGWLWRPPPSP